MYAGRSYHQISATSQIVSNLLTLKIWFELSKFLFRIFDIFIVLTLKWCLLKTSPLFQRNLFQLLPFVINFYQHFLHFFRTVWRFHERISIFISWSQLTLIGMQFSFESFMLLKFSRQVRQIFVGLITCDSSFVVEPIIQIVYVSGEFLEIFWSL